ncbi:MAG TPA: hypothetical protein VMT29_05195 [Steroidobacteraceae bacterium]|nr:hypothetical protein [Steroidobacteraceae bacterium]
MARIRRGLARPRHASPWHWDDDRTLRFQAAEDWPIDTTFHVVLEQGALEAHVRLHDEDFSFRTAGGPGELRETPQPGLV